MSSSVLWIVLAGAILIVDVAVIITIIYYRRRKTALREAPPETGASGSSQRIGKGQSGQGICENVQYNYEYIQGHSKRPPSLSLSVPCPSSAPAIFTVTRENAFDRFFKRLGVALEIDTNDTDFDNQYYIASDYPEFAQQTFGHSRKREAVKNLFAFGFKTLTLKNNVLTAKWDNFRPKEPPMEQTLSQLAADLVRVAQNMPSAPPPAPLPWKKIRLAVFIVHGLILLSGIVFAMMGGIEYTPLDGGSLFLQSLKISAPLWILSLWITLQLLKGHSTSHHEWLIVFFISLIGFPLAGFGYGATGNAWLDKSEPVIHSVTVADKYITTNKNNKSYHMVVNSWREQPETESFSINRSSYNSIQPGITKALIRTKPGYFKFEWLVDYQLENP